MSARSLRGLALLSVALSGTLTAGCNGYWAVVAVAPSSQIIVLDPTQSGGSIGGPKKNPAGTFTPAVAATGGATPAIEQAGTDQ